jgi:hypothetical protein
MKELIPVDTCSRPNPVPGSVRCGEKVSPAKEKTPGNADSCSLPAIPSGRCARFGDG